MVVDNSVAAFVFVAPDGVKQRIPAYYPVFVFCKIRKKFELFGCQFYGFSVSDYLKLIEIFPMVTESSITVPLALFKSAMHFAYKVASEKGFKT